MVVIAIIKLLVEGAASSMAKGTASVEPAGGAEKATTASLEALELGAYGGAENRCSFLRWHAGGDIKGGWVTAGLGNIRQVRKWKNASVKYSRRLPAMAGVQMGIMLDSR
jgi:hypothetical protein